jgi:hypothetical protein
MASQMEKSHNVPADVMPGAVRELAVFGSVRIICTPTLISEELCLGYHSPSFRWRDLKLA